MEILVVDNGRISKYKLSDNSVEDYSILYRPIGEKQQYLITLVKDNNAWYLSSNGNVNVIQDNIMSGRVKLEDYSKYNLKIVGLNNLIDFYAIPNVNERFYRLDCSSISSVNIGNSPNCNIYYKNDFIKDVHFVIAKNNDKTILTVNEDVNNKKIYVNNHQIFDDIVLNVGDLVFVEGLKLIWMDEFLEINSPNNMVQVSGLSAYTKLQNEVNNNFSVSNLEEKNVELYKEIDCFFHIPRIKEEIKVEEVLIDAPPSSELTDELPFFLTIGSTITMSASSLMMAWNVGYGLVSKTKTIIMLIPQIVMCFAMIVGSLILPKLSKNYQKKKKKKNEKIRQEKYTEYLKSKELVISTIIKNQEQIMKDNILSIDDCVSVISSRNKNLWSRQIEDNDFLTIRLGVGNCNSKIIIKAPEEHFSLDTDNLLQNVYDMVEKYKKLTNVPISISLVEKRIVSFIFDNKLKYKYIEGLLIQLVALHSPVDLKIIVMTNDENKDNWGYIKHFTHCLSNDKNQRFFSVNIEQAKEISTYLVEQLKERRENEDVKKERGTSSNINKYKDFSTYYLIITDDYSIAKETKIVEEIMDDSVNYGFSLIAIDSSMKNLPTKSELFINVGQKDGVVIEKNMTADTQLQFVNEYNVNCDMSDICRIVSNIPVSYKSSASILPQSLTFLEMYGVSKIEQLNISSRWKSNNPVTNLNAPIGVHVSGDLFKLNLHEKFHGPHGLIAGSTGSGKSEFIITYILSMAINYHPYEVQFVLIDYKGGGLAGAFENKEKGIKLPHLAGTITNLDTSEMNRTLVSIQSELKRRQRKFNEVRDKIGVSTIDIYKYQQLYREGIVDVPMSHLFIISDEFAELKSQQPEFMQQLISTARIGRSLGVHLILATQKPSGVVNDQIWSNSKFKVCLKVQDKSDSMEMLKRPEAASIKETGRFYLQVGYDDYFDIGQSGWSGAKYVPSDQIIKKIDDSINFIDNVGNVIKTINEVVVEKEDNVDRGDQLTNLVKYICDLSSRENIVSSTLWLDAIPAIVDLNNLKQKYSYKPIPYYINPAIGEYDNPVNQEQGLVNLDFTSKGNTLIYGKNGSGKEHLLTTIIWSTIIEHTPDEVNIYVLDYGAEILKFFKKMPHVGDVLTADNSEKVIDLMLMIEKEIEVRKELFADYGGNYVDYINVNGNNKLPLLLVIINNYEIFCENNSKLSENIQSFYRDGSKYGIVFVITTISINSVRARMLQNFVNKISLQLQNDVDYRTVLKAPRGLIPSKIFGRGLIEMNDTAYEFQTAMIIDKHNLNALIREACDKLNQAYTTRAKSIPSLPNVVSLDKIDKPVRLDSIPIGYDINTKKQVMYNFEKNNINQIITNAMNEDKISFIYALIKMISKVTNVVVIDFVNAIDKKIDNILYINSDFDVALNELNNKIFNSDTKKVCFVLGIGLISEELSEQCYKMFTNILESVKQYKGLNFIFIDTYNSYKKLQIENWYQLNVNNLNGIWLGKEIGTQILINITDLSLEDRKLDFYCMAFAINNGSRIALKHVVDMEGSDEK